MCAALLLAAVPGASAADSARATRAGGLRQAFDVAAARYHVPVQVVLGVSYLQSRWDTHGMAPSVDGGYGPMHLTDVRAATARAGRATGGGRGAPARPVEDPRGDTSRPAPPRAVAGAGAARIPDRLRTLTRAARLTGLPADRLRRDPAANVAGGAALLADAQRRLGAPTSQDPGDWYGAVARFSGAGNPGTAAAYADEVYDVVRSGARRTTDTRDRLVLAADPGVRPRGAQVPRVRPHAAGAQTAECPSTLSCTWVGAPYEQFGDGDYGNHDVADRPATTGIDTIVLHDTETDWATALQLVQDPTYVSWHYTVRSSDGSVAQHVPTKDVAWHAGNWYTNTKSIGIEQEGFLATPDAWFTESMYRASAKLVGYLAQRYGIPLDRRHILGHDNVPGGTASAVAGMHTDPGPYWDWGHFFDLLGAPFTGSADDTSSSVVTVRPDVAANTVPYTGCAKAGEACPAHGSTALALHVSPDADSALVADPGLHPDGSPSTSDVNDVGARASTGQQYAVAGREGDWTAIWYLGRKAWFHDPASRPTAVGSTAAVVTPRAGLDSVPVYGRAYPEASAYPSGVPVQPLSVLPYTFSAGQRYVSGGLVPGEYLYAPSFDTATHRLVRGEEDYVEIQFGHRVAYVKASDVTAG